MAATNHAAAVRAGTMAAARLHRKLGLRETIEARGGSVDVFEAIHAVGLPLLLRPLQGLLGAYLVNPGPGALVTTERPMSIQRFTAAHELGHFLMGHRPSLDDETILRRMTTSEDSSTADLREIEADAFAVAFMMPRWLFLGHAARQRWTAEDLSRPDRVYQLALRIGASYEATCWTLAGHRLIAEPVARELLRTRPRQLKAKLLEPDEPPDDRRDVWLLTGRDAGTRIDGSRNDLFVLRLEEHSGGGYLWDIGQLRASGFGIVRDELEVLDGDTVGGPVIRRVTAAPTGPCRGRIALDERRPWEPDQPIASLGMEIDLTGPEEAGLSRAERGHRLEAVERHRRGRRSAARVRPGPRPGTAPHLPGFRRERCACRPAPRLDPALLRVRVLSRPAPGAVAARHRLAAPGDAGRLAGRRPARGTGLALPVGDTGSGHLGTTRRHRDAVRPRR